MLIFIAGAAVLHIIAVILALRLIRVTGWKVAWIVIAVTILLQAVRRFVELTRVMGGDSSLVDPVDNLLSFIISVFMLIGLAMIGPLFRSIKRSEEVLRDANMRAAEEKAEREKLINELQDAFANIKELKNFIPICSYCRKLRDDDGYWQQLEAYFMKNTDTKFSHGICPECSKKFFSSEEKEGA